MENNRDMEKGADDEGYIESEGRYRGFWARYWGIKIEHFLLRASGAKICGDPANGLKSLENEISSSIPQASNPEMAGRNYRFHKLYSEMIRFGKKLKPAKKSEGNNPVYGCDIYQGLLARYYGLRTEHFLLRISGAKMCGNLMKGVTSLEKQVIKAIFSPSDRKNEEDKEIYHNPDQNFRLRELNSRVIEFKKELDPNLKPKQSFYSKLCGRIAGYAGRSRQDNSSRQSRPSSED